MSASLIDTTFATAHIPEEATGGELGINTPINAATIDSGFEKRDLLVKRNGQRVYFDVFEEAFNYLSNKDPIISLIR